MNKDIPAGYQLHVLSWENDADHYKTEIFSGLVELEVKFLIALLKAYQPLGGDDVADGALLDIFVPLMEKYQNVLTEKFKNAWFVKTDVEAGEVMMALVSYISEDYGTNYMRAYDSHKVFYLAAPVSDVTEQFK